MKPLPRIAVVSPTQESSIRTHASRPQGSSFWLFLRTLFIGSAGLGVLSALTVLAASAWLTANQRAEAEKTQPWIAPSFTTTAVTTGGLLARWMDSDGDPSNGHTYVNGIYNLWKSQQSPEIWSAYSENSTSIAALPPLWRIEFKKDMEEIIATNQISAKKALSETISEKRKLDF